MNPIESTCPVCGAVSRVYLPSGSDEGGGKTPHFREGMKSSLIVMYCPYQPLTILHDQCKSISTNGAYKILCDQCTGE
jgi:C4-type Zn-finger protein